MISEPVRPPASPVAITGSPRDLSARATLTPLPPGWTRPGWQRCRWPSWRFGTRSVLSIAALRVMVRNTRRSPRGRRLTPDGLVMVPIGLDRDRGWKPALSRSWGLTATSAASSGPRPTS